MCIVEFSIGTSSLCLHNNWAKTHDRQELHDLHVLCACVASVIWAECFSCWEDADHFEMYQIQRVCKLRDFQCCRRSAYFSNTVCICFIIGCIWFIVAWKTKGSLWWESQSVVCRSKVFLSLYIAFRKPGQIILNVTKLRGSKLFIL